MLCAMPLQDEYIRTALRLPPELHQRIHQAADKAGRSFNAELIARISGSFDSQSIEARLASIEQQLSQLLKKGK